jgi:hypothetical protein
VVSIKKNPFTVRCWWLMPVILAAQEAEIRKDLSSKPAQGWLLK